MSYYEKLPNDLLVAFYQEINKNIKKGILTEAMYNELKLIEEVARKRNILLGYLKGNELENEIDVQESI